MLFILTVFLIVVIFVVAALLYASQYSSKNGPSDSGFSSSYQGVVGDRSYDTSNHYHPGQFNDLLPNGYRRSDYYRMGFTDGDIRGFGLDRDNAPSPEMGAWMMADYLSDGQLDGHIDWDFFG